MDISAVIQTTWAALGGVIRHTSLKQGPSERFHRSRLSRRQPGRPEAGRTSDVATRRPVQAGAPLRAATGRESRVRYVVGPARNDLGRGAVLVRPDGTVAWAGDRAPDREAFTRAVGRWSGSPAVRQSGSPKNFRHSAAGSTIGPSTSI
ncbi:aromatic-ring hydroxylase C-terminal domain-containing protein [Streptomyces sp. NBC_01334]|uniref:aromatic-ring hydroxylase C-terminal domain-containing protein n=1 Tax=Streptomyces sp. NBC_01334 TaxID=2903827 RepID=UPI003FA3D3A7